MTYFRLPEVYDSYRHSCTVELNDDNVVLKKAEIPETAFVQQFDYGYFLGVRLGEWDGWVKYYKYHTNLLDVEPVMVAKEQCCGIILCSNTEGYVLTGPVNEGYGNIYKLYLPESKTEWEWSLVGTVDGFPCSYVYLAEEQTLLIATTKEIVTVSSDNQISTVIQSKYLDLLPTSILICKNQLWCGLHSGLLRIDMTTLEETWYWLDWDN